MKSFAKAKDLAQTMVEIGQSLQRKTIAIITNMDQPLGQEIGNANEVKEAIAILRNQGTKDETEIALTVAAYMAVLGGAFSDFNLAYKALEDLLISGAAINKFAQLIEIQGGDKSVIDDLTLLPNAKFSIEVLAEKSGIIQKLNAEEIGIAAMLLGAGRKTKADNIDYGAGVSLVKKVGDVVKEGEALCVLHTNKEEFLTALDTAKNAFLIGKDEVELSPYILARIT